VQKFNSRLFKINLNLITYWN